MKKQAKLLRSSVLLAIAGVAHAETYFETPRLYSGQDLVLHLRFQQPLDRQANAFIVNLGGGGGIPDQVSLTLMVGGKAIGHVDTFGQCMACALFMVGPASDAGYPWATSVTDPESFEGFLHGDIEGSVVYRATINRPDGYATLSGLAPHAAFVTGPYLISDIWPAPEIRAEVLPGVSAVPEPSALPLAALGLLLTLTTSSAGATRRGRKP